MKSLRRLRALAALTKVEVEQTIKNMMDGIATLGRLTPYTPLSINVAGNMAMQTFNLVGSSPRAVSNFFASRGFRHISAGMMIKTQGDSVARVSLVGAGVATRITFTVQTSS